MAERYAVGTGNWSSVGTWDGGASLPTTGDTVHANTYTVTIDQNITVGSINTIAGATAAAGGLFTTSGTVTITADVVAGTSRCLNLNANAILAGDSTGGSTSSIYGVYAVSGAVHNGNSMGGTATVAYGTYLNAGAIQNGNSLGGGAASSYGTYVGTSAIHNGNSTGGGTGSSRGNYITIGGVQNGNSTGGGASAAYGNYMDKGAVQNGNSSGGTNSTAYGSYLTDGAMQIGNAIGSASATGTYLARGSFFVGAATGGIASGAHGIEIPSAGNSFAKVSVASGSTSGAYGVKAGTGVTFSVVVIDSESGTYAKDLASAVDTTTDNMDLFALLAAGGGGDATAANQATIIAHLTDLKGTGFAKDTHSLTDILADVTGIAGSAMRGTDSAFLAASAPANFSSLGINGSGHVSRVTLSDTVTANTDLVTAASIADAVWDEAQSGHVASGSFGEMATELAAVLVDTAVIGAAGAGLTAIPWNSSWDAEVQSEVQDAIEVNHLDHLLAVDYDPASKPGTSTALLNELIESDGGVSRFTTNALENSSGASVSAIADAVWDEAQSGHVTAGSFGEIATEIASILVDTAEIGAAGAGLTAVPWNAAWDAEVQSECNDALVAIHLDHLLAVDYDPASKPGISTALLNELVVDDAGVSQFTTNALENAPSGGATEANQTTIISHLTDIKGATWSSSTDTLESIRDKQTDIEADTQDLQTQIGAAGAGLTAVPWNAAWDAEVQSEVQDAIEVNHLDHLLAVDYDPASKPGVSTALLNELIGDDGGVSQFTANALENATSATAAAIADAVWDELQAGHVTAGSFGEIATEIASILVDTAEIGAAGAGLTAVPWNASWDAEVQSECNDALVAIHLDHLLAVDYDPTAKPGISTALLNEIVEDDGGVSRFTANALENAPGASAAAIADAVWDEAQSGHVASGSFGEMATELAAVLVDTAEIGAAGAGLTAVPWNSSWDTEVQSECNDALVAIHLDHLLAADYDPASKPGTSTALLNELVENDGGVSRFTTNALENAPGASAAAIADAVWDEAQSGHVTAGSFGEIATEIASVLVDTAVIGAAGAGLTAIPWNSSWDAEVQSEVNDALTAFNVVATSDLPTNFADLSITASTGRIDVSLIEGVDATNQIRDAIVDDATRIDASALNTLSGHDPGATLSSLTAAQVNAEIVDALDTDTYAELGAVPAATASLSDKIAWLFMLARNKVTQTATTVTVRNDADSGNVATSTVSDNGTTATRGEFS